MSEYIRARAEPRDGCWMWLRYCNQDGYGIGSWNGIREGAHRIAYRAFRGEIPEGCEIDHLCRNRSCVNPDHLEAVAHKINVHRGEAPPADNARKTHCPCGREYDIETKRGGRGCSVCKKAAHEQWRRASGIIPRDEYLASRRAQTHCKHGHEFSEENTAYDKAGRRVCRACKRSSNETIRRQRGQLPSSERVALNRLATHCPNGHEWIPENTYTYGGGKYRYCRECNRIAARKRYARQSATRPDGR